jgi:DNA replication protein DnaC
LAGNPGTGKTHIAIGIGIKACINDFKVLFTTVPRLLTQIKECRSEKTLRQLENRFQKYDLVICDEFGYISFDKEGAELLFSHLSLRAGMKSTIVTTNLPFNKWDEIFGDKVLTTALVDRLTHKAYIVNMNGKSYRTKETVQWNKK